MLHKKSPNKVHPHGSLAVRQGVANEGVCEEGHNLKGVCDLLPKAVGQNTAKKQVAWCLDG